MDSLPPVHDEVDLSTEVPLAAADDEIVLPWWQHPLNILTLLVATALVAAMIGWMVGDSNAGPDTNDVDIGFLQDMREHHEQAVGMGFIYLELPDTDARLRTVARSIVFGQGIDIGRMIQLLRHYDASEVNEGETSMAWMGMPSAVGEMPGMASEAELAQLADASGAAADELFVELMVTHHEGGIHMAEYAVEHAESSEVTAMAASMAESQGHEIDELERLVD